MKSVYVKANDEVKAVDHNNLVDDTKELEAKISQIPAGKDGNGVKEFINCQPFRNNSSKFSFNEWYFKA